ncbi:MAG: hypothetical protein K9N35_08295, partial [Candidatus Marinimicrobia bacterium]|nr:hypothetical protein [Candidatus Neomarinimicrobiota bacterium]
MTTQQQLLSGELNKTHDPANFVENFHGAECYALIGQAGLLSEDKVKLILDQGKVSEGHNKILDALMRITYAKIAWKEGNFKYA